MMRSRHPFTIARLMVVIGLLAFLMAVVRWLLVHAPGAFLVLAVFLLLIGVGVGLAVCVAWLAQRLFEGVNPNASPGVRVRTMVIDGCVAVLVLGVVVVLVLQIMR